MNINTWIKPKVWTVDGDYNLKNSDILSAHRFIYLFFDKNDLLNYKNEINVNKNIYGKAIQINLSCSEGNNLIDLAPWMRGSDNSTYISIGMYIYDTIFDSSITNIQTAQFTLLESMISSNTNDFDTKKAFYQGFSIYSKDARDDEYMRMALAWDDYGPSIPEPMYYTMKHQEMCSGDLYCLSSLNCVVFHEGHELIDDQTRISVMDTSKMDTMEHNMRNKLFEVKNMINNGTPGINMYDSMQLSESSLFATFESMQSGYTYIYDSNMGFNIITNNKSFIPFTKYQLKEKVVNDLERTLDIVKTHAKYTEEQFGNVRISFTPLYMGDKLDIFFKDWNHNNQPVVKPNISIDNGTKLKVDIGEQLDILNMRREEQNGEEF